MRSIVSTSLTTLLIPTTPPPIVPKSIVCTVFEGRYHLGVGALANSLYGSGYRGVLYAGYRGELPPWATPATTEANGNTTFRVADGLDLYFARQDTDEMLANIKPDLMQQVWEHYGEALEYVFYIDCDIVVKAKWAHFEDWARYGVALCEDMNSPVPVHSPLRQRWREYYAKYGVDYVAKDDVYVNGGFVGIHRDYRGFAALWDRLQVHMKEYTGKQHRSIGIADRWNPFHYMDQDALNVAKDLTPHISVMGPQAMDFGRHGYVMSHAAGVRKPWDIAYLRDIIAEGARPSFADKHYWHHVDGPITLFSRATVVRKRLALRAASFIGRFFTRV